MRKPFDFSMTLPEEKEQRLKICEACPFLKKDERKCTKCSCNIDSKSDFKTSHCPLLLW